MHLDTGHRANNFDFLRIAAALMVLVGHAYVLSGREALEPAARHTGLDGLGALGVSIFFVISGFLVTGSYDRLRNAPAYMVARLLRIIPALAVAVVLCALVLGPVVTTLPKGAYFADPQTWLYVVRNVLLYPVAYLLPGVFADNPYPGAVNGSLWTLRLEFTCYLLLPLLDWRRLLRPGVVTTLTVVAGLAYAALAVAGALETQAAMLAATATGVPAAPTGAGPAGVPDFAVLALRFGFLFLAGAALYWLRDARWLRSGWTLAAAALAFALVALSERWAMAATPLILPVLVVAFALRPLPGLSSFSRYGDYSYGVYIYAFPVQQAWMHLLGPERLGVWAYAGLTLLTVLPLAAASWLLVEKPALDLKERLRVRFARFDRGAVLPELSELKR